MSKLIDLDCDGTPELYCCASESLVYPDHSVPYNVVYIQKMYAYDGKLYELTIPKRPSNFENTEKTVVTKFMVGTIIPIWSVVRIQPTVARYLCNQTGT